ncbi:MAG: peptidyl-prolyl cis-trans isomerase [Pseudomonadota bacterium]
MAYYENNKDTYDVEEQRSVNKLFVKVEEDADEAAINKSRAAIEKALGMVNTGMGFEEVLASFTEEGIGALEFSEHTFMTKGVMGDEIDEFLFSADENDISGVIESEKGLNIVKVGEIRGGPKNVFERVAEQVEFDYKQNQAELEYFEMSDQLTTLAYEQPDSLDAAAEAIEVTVEESDYFNRFNKNDDVTSNDRLIAASFNQELIDSGINSDAIELGENHIVVFRVLDYKPASIKPIEDVREDVIADIKQENAEEMLVGIGQDIIQQVSDGLAPEEVATDIDVKWNNEEDVKRDATSVNRSVLRKAFQLTPVNDQPAVDGYQLGSGDYAVVVVTAVNQGTLDNLEDEDSRKVDLLLRRVKSTAEWREFLSNVREQANVTIFEENI